MHLLWESPRYGGFTFRNVGLVSGKTAQREENRALALQRLLFPVALKHNRYSFTTYACGPSLVSKHPYIGDPIFAKKYIAHELCPRAYTFQVRTSTDASIYLFVFFVCAIQSTLCHPPLLLYFEDF
jgi:hypothetical protein